LDSDRLENGETQRLSHPCVRRLTHLAKRFGAGPRADQTRGRPGIRGAPFEEFLYDGSGQPLCGTFAIVYAIDDALGERVFVTRLPVTPTQIKKALQCNRGM
jgi:hypothetical protein